MKTYTKLPIEQVTTITNWESITVDWPQMYQVVETIETTTSNKTTRENFVNTIASLEQQKSNYISKIDAEIAENESILAEIDKL